MKNRLGSSLTSYIYCDVLFNELDEFLLSWSIDSFCNHQDYERDSFATDVGREVDCELELEIELKLGFNSNLNMFTSLTNRIYPNTSLAY